MNRRNALLLFGILAIVCVIAIVAAAETNEPEDRGTRADETYVGTDSCVCHSETITSWEDTAHGIDFANDWEYDGTPTNKYTLYSGSCISCHVVGYNQTSGFNPAQAWNSTNTSTNIGNVNLLRIGCENCHGPGSAHIASPSSENININGNPYLDSCAGTDDAGCHSENRQYSDGIPGFAESNHVSIEDDEYDASWLNDYCAECHSPSQYTEGTSYSNNTIYNLTEHIGVRCADCHNPHEETEYAHQLVNDPDMICDDCHSGGHHENTRTLLLEGTPTVDVTEYPYMPSVSCRQCHMFGTGFQTPEPFLVVGHKFSLRYEACVSCHNDTYDNMPDSDYADYDTNSTVKAEWDAWAAELNASVATWRGVVEAQQARYDDKIEHLEELLEEVEELMETAEENGLWTEELEEEFENAEYNFELTEHGDRGAHNPYYAAALMEGSEDLFNDILEELHNGVLEGTVTDEDANPVDGAFIKAGDFAAYTGTDGTYMLELPPGTHTITAQINQVTQTVSDIEIESAVVETQNFTLGADFDNDGTPDSTDTDDDDDGVPDDTDAFDDDPTEWTDTDSDGIGNNEDTDDDGDGVLDTEDTAPLDSTVTAKIGEGDDEEEADNTMYLIIIVVLIVVIILVAVMGAKKGGNAPAPKSEPPAEEPAEEPVEEDMPEEEE